jgi:hypothetical protein
MGRLAAELRDDQADDPGRAALIAKIDEVAPGPDNREVRRALGDAARDMLKTARLAGSSSPFDHVRMAIEKAAASPKRRDTIESLARGILKNWAREGLPAVVAPEPPGRAKPIVASDRAAEYRAEAKRVAAEKAAVKARWDARPEAERAAIEARVRADNPVLARFPVAILSLCLAAMDGGSP